MGNEIVRSHFIERPRPGDYPRYAEMYMKLIPQNENILLILERNFYELRSYIIALSYDQLTFRYDENKWSIKEILVHLIDDERIFSCRALRFARNEKQNLIGFDQDEYATFSRADLRSCESIFDEYEAVRKSTIALFRNLPEDAFDRMGHGTGTFNDATVRALLFHIAGHELHHFNIIKTLYCS